MKNQLSTTSLRLAVLMLTLSFGTACLPPTPTPTPTSSPSPPIPTVRVQGQVFSYANAPEAEFDTCMRVFNIEGTTFLSEFPIPRSGRFDERIPVQDLGWRLVLDDCDSNSNQVLRSVNWASVDQPNTIVAYHMTSELAGLVQATLEQVGETRSLSNEGAAIIHHLDRRVSPPRFLGGFRVADPRMETVYYESPDMCTSPFHNCDGGLNTETGQGLGRAVVLGPGQLSLSTSSTDTGPVNLDVDVPPREIHFHAIDLFQP